MPTESIKRLTGGFVLGIGGLLLAVVVFVVPIWVTVNCERSDVEALGNAPTSELAPAASAAGPGSVRCNLRGQNLIGIPWRRRTIDNLAGVELNTQKFRPRYVYRAFLYTYESEIPLATYSVGYDTAQRTQTQLKDFLDDNSQASVRVAYSPPWVTLVTAILLAILMLGVGGFILWI